MKLRARSVLFAAVVLGTMVLTSCITPVGVSGPCTAQSNSTITLDVYWSGADIISSAAAKSPTASSFLKKSSRAQAQASRPLHPRAQADFDSTLVMIEAPVGWTPTTATWEGVLVNGVPESGVAALSDDPPYCAFDFSSAARPGYARKYFKITPSTQVDLDTTDAVLHVTYTTSVLAPGIYHPMVMSVLEVVDTESCFAGMAFHRVTVGSLDYVPFSVAPFFNRDVVVNAGDATQDPLLDVGGTTFAFTVDPLPDDTLPVLPANGLLTTALAQAYFAEAPRQFDAPDCMPDYQAGFSSASNGANVWIPAAVDDALTIPVPSRRYSELAVYVTGSVVTPQPDQTFDTAPNAIHVTMHYEGGATSTVDVLLPPGGLPLPLAEALTGFVPVPSFTMALSAAVPLPPAVTEEVGVGGINAILLSPDPAQRLQSITIVPYAPDAPLTAQGSIEQNVAVWGAFGMAFPDPAPDIAMTKQVTSGGPIFVGSNLTWRITATNQGTAVSSPVTITDTLPASVTYVSATPSSGSCSFVAGTVTCNVGTLAAGASATVDITATVQTAGAILNTATATSAGDANALNNSGAATITAFAAPVPAPSLSMLGMMALAALLTIAALTRMRL